jgi:hypothetical protein
MESFFDVFAGDNELETDCFGLDPCDTFDIPALCKFDAFDSGNGEMGLYPLSEDHEQPHELPIPMLGADDRQAKTLPKDARGEMRNWLIAHYAHPYPTDSEKNYFMIKFGLTRRQIDTFFVNGRRRVLDRKGIRNVLSNLSQESSLVVTLGLRNPLSGSRFVLLKVPDPRPMRSK